MDFLTQQFIATASRFRNWFREVNLRIQSLDNKLSSLAEAVHNLENAVKDDKHSHDKSEDKPLPVAATLSTPVAISVKTETDEQKSVWKSIKTGLEVSGILAGIAYAVITYGIMNASIDATNFAGRQAEYARKSLNETVKNFAIDQRPYLVLKRAPSFTTPAIGPNEEIQVKLLIGNIGKTPAINKLTYLHLFPYHIPKGSRSLKENTVERFLIGKFQEIRDENAKGIAKIATIPEWGEDVAPGDEYEVTTQPITLEMRDILQLRDPKNPGMFLFLISLTSYTDSFGKSHQTEICQYWYAGQLWHKCERFERIR